MKSIQTERKISLTDDGVRSDFAVCRDSAGGKVDDGILNRVRDECFREEKRRY